MSSSHVEESKLTMTRRTVNGAVAALLLLPALASAADVVLPPPDKQMSWTPEQKIVGFRNMARIYGGDVVHHGTKVLPLPRSARELEVQYLDTAGHSVT